MRRAARLPQHRDMNRTLTATWMLGGVLSLSLGLAACGGGSTAASIQKGTLGDFKNVQLDSAEKQTTPYYVKVRVTNLGATPPAGNDPDVTFRAIDDRGQAQPSVTFLGTFSRCDDKQPPKPFKRGASYESCLTYLMPGGGSITSVHWNDGPLDGKTVSPYFEKPIVWKASA
jgi:hypothetical protein